MTNKELKEVLNFRGNITVSELARVMHARERNKQPRAIEPSMSKAIQSMVEEERVAKKLQRAIDIQLEYERRG